MSSNMHRKRKKAIRRKNRKEKKKNNYKKYYNIKDNSNLASESESTGFNASAWTVD